MLTAEQAVQQQAALAALGWGAPFDAAFAALEAQAAAKGRAGLLQAARVGSDLGAALELMFPAATMHGDLPLSLRVGQSRPAVGDWVAAEISGGRAMVVSLLPRRSVFQRRAVGKAEVAQAVAANVDTLLVALPLGDPLNARSLERYLTLAWESGAHPAVLLTKADLVDAFTREEALAEARALAPGATVLAVARGEHETLREVAALAGPGKTAALLGPSGAGKSTLVNALLGEERLATASVRPGDHKGRHTTTRRQLVLLPGGGLLLDTPGMRALGLWEAPAGMEQAFADITALGAGCRFSDCAHRAEPGCAVEAAVDDGALEGARLDAFRTLQDELAAQHARGDARSRAQKSAADRVLAKALRARVKDKREPGAE